MGVVITVSRFLDSAPGPSFWQRINLERSLFKSGEIAPRLIASQTATLRKNAISGLQ